MSDKNILIRDARRYMLATDRAYGAEVHGYLPELCNQLKAKKIERRDFLRQACLLGMTVTTAYAMADVLTGDAPIKSAMAATPKSGGTLKVSMRVQEMTDPASFNWAEKSNVARFIVEHLTRTQADNVTVPYLAKSWEASDDLKTWVFHLRDDVTWSNGDKFTSADVAHTVNRWLDPATGSSNLGLFGAMVEEGADGKKRGIANAVEVVDSHTIKFNLKQAALAMPENFYNYPTAIVHKGFGKDYEADLSKNPIGTGAFKLTDFAIGERAILKKERDWWAGPFYLDEIHYYDHGEDTNAWVAALASKQVDMIYRVPNNAMETVKRLPFVDIHEATTAQTGVMRFRVTEKPFDNPKVRQAIAACMDHQEILDKAFSGLGQVAENHHVCPIHPEYAALPPLKRDVEKAKKLLAEAGYPDGITVEIANGDTEGSWMTDACAIFKSQAAAAGITININKMPANQYWEVWDKAPWGYTAWTHRPLGTMVLGLAYRKGVPWNEAAYDNPKFDAALDDAEGTLAV
ncbi:MAG: ABC transporter substrate-binding protein, partial [Proteobacteria bacterium]|nr:ABC transporter substrate-binding protein [Pseudomonadota bacterium]